MFRPYFALQVFIYHNLHDIHRWSTTNAAVVVVSYDKFTRLKKQALDATLKSTGSEPTEKVLCIVFVVTTFALIASLLYFITAYLTLLHFTCLPG